MSHFRLAALLVFCMAGCAEVNVPDSPRRWVMPDTIILEVPGTGAYFPPKDGLPAIIIVRDIHDPLVVPHEAGHAIWQATGQLQKYK